MTTKTRIKPKFRVGQVVCVRNGYMHQQTYLRIAGFTWAKDGREYWDVGGQRYIEFCLRPLTKRERGQP
jgi:hypothetical protein